MEGLTHRISMAKYEWYLLPYAHHLKRGKTLWQINKRSWNAMSCVPTIGGEEKTWQINWRNWNAIILLWTQVLPASPKNNGQQYMAESETSTQQHGRTRSFLALSQSFFCREIKNKPKKWNCCFPLGSGAFPGVCDDKEGWLAGVAALEGLLQSGQQNRANGNEKQASNLSLTQRQMWLLIWQVLKNF